MQNLAITTKHIDHSDKNKNFSCDTYHIEWHELDTWMNAPRVQKEMTSSLDGSKGFTGTESLKESRDLMRDGWQEGVDMLNHGLTHEIKDSGIEQAEVWETAPVGAFPIVPLYNAGVDEHMLLPSEEHDEPIVNMIVDVASIASVSAKQMMNRGIAIASLINHIEQAGKRVRLQARWGTRNHRQGGKNAYQFMIMVKDAHEHMDMGRVAFAIGNPSFSRRVCFKMLECTARGHMGGYGSTLNLDEVQEIGKDVFYISELPYQEKHLFSDAQGAHDFTFKQWNAELERSV